MAADQYSPCRQLNKSSKRRRRMWRRRRRRRKRRNRRRKKKDEEMEQNKINHCFIHTSLSLRNSRMSIFFQQNKKSALSLMFDEYLMVEMSFIYPSDSAMDNIYWLVDPSTYFYFNIYLLVDLFTYFYYNIYILMDISTYLYCNLYLFVDLLTH